MDVLSVYINKMKQYVKRDFLRLFVFEQKQNGEQGEFREMSETDFTPEICYRLNWKSNNCKECYYYLEHKDKEDTK